MRAIILPALIFLFSDFSMGQPSTPSLKISHLKGDFYVYTTYGTFNNTKYPANGLYVITRNGAVIIDSPWDTTQFQPLLDSIKRKHAMGAVVCIATHFHEDRTGGLEYYNKKGIKTFTTLQTDQLSKVHHKKRAEYLLHHDTTFSVGQYKFQTYYPGHGHAPDNIVIWFPKEKVLYGGCLVKSIEDQTLGNLSDANVETYAETLRKVMEACPDPQFIIPGHNDWKDVASLKHTLQMAEKAKAKKR